MDILCSDKTGTLTKNQLALGTPVVFKAGSEQDLILNAALASRTEGGDTIDAAVLAALRDPAQLKTYQIVRFISVRSGEQTNPGRGEARHRGLQGLQGGAAGNPRSHRAGSSTRAKVEKEVERLAAKGYRTLGVARTDLAGKWELLGLLPMSDPPRDDSASTIATARRMGLQVRMVTGDNVAIARGDFARTPTRSENSGCHRTVCRRQGRR